MNDLAPRHVFLTTDGKHVVTMDEWEGAGRLPLVIYGPRGELKGVFSLDSLGVNPREVPDFFGAVRRSVGSIYWNRHAISFFGRHDATFCIWLPWGRLVIVDLNNGAILTETDTGRLLERQTSDWAALQAYGIERVRAIATEYLVSEDPQKRITGVLAAGRLNMREAAPILRRLLNDFHAIQVIRSGQPGWRYPVRTAAKRALEAMGEEVGQVKEEE
ncbi:MAG: hypothetical protein AB1716_06090 [Planctomycetota bacterium]